MTINQYYTNPSPYLTRSKKPRHFKVCAPHTSSLTSRLRRPSVCGRADPVVLASAAEAEILRLLFPDGAPVVAVSGGAFPGAAFGQEARVTGGATSVKGRWPWMVRGGGRTGSSTDEMWIKVHHARTIKLLWESRH